MKFLLSNLAPKRRPSVVRLALLAIFIFSAAHALPETANASGGNFTLQSAKGPVSLSDFRGKVVVIYFGYVSCGSICPISVSKIGSALRKLTNEERNHAAGIFITIDPERDTPELTSNYAAQFDPLITGLSGNVIQINAVAKQYGAVFRKREIKSSMEYSCDHSSNTYIVNPSGKLVKILPHNISPGDILDEIRKNIGNQ